MADTNFPTVEPFAAPPMKAKRRPRKRTLGASTPPVPRRAWTIRQLVESDLGSETFWYERIARGDVIAHKLGGKTIIFTENLESCLASCPRAVSRYRAGGRTKAR